MTYTTILAWLHTHALPVTAGAGLLACVFLLVRVRRAIRRDKADKLAVGVAVLIASGFSAQGMFEVATQRLHLPWELAGCLFVVAEAAMLASAVRAHRMWQATSTDTAPGTLGPHGHFVWVIAAVAGTVVSLNAHSPSEYVLRLAMPLLVAGLWRLGYTSTAMGVRPRRDGAVTWRWTPRRLAVALGLVEPGERDIATVHRERRVRQLTTHAHGLHHGPRWLKPWHTARLRRLTLLADDEMVAEVQARVDRVHHITANTAPTGDRIPPPPGGHGDATTPPAKARSGRKVPVRPASAMKVEKAARRLPADATVAAVAARAGVSESTARRYLPPTGPAVTVASRPVAPPAQTTPVNGANVTG